MAFYIGMAACKFQMQRISFALPLILATPVAIGVFLLDCHYNFLGEVTTTCSLNPKVRQGGVSVQLADCPNMTWGNWHHYCLFGALWWLSLLVLGRHIWRYQSDNTATLDRLFINANYCGVLTAEHIILNRRRNRRNVTTEHIVDDVGNVKQILYKFLSLTHTEEQQSQTGPQTGSQTGPQAAPGEAEEERVAPMLFACATMWHETRTEMVQLLKSVHRLDKNQYIRKIANERFDGYDPKFYNFEAHIFFDDAMELDDFNHRVPNTWVKDLVSSMSEACSSVHGKPMLVHDPFKLPTPYGGQLIWRMPGDNLLFVHLKDMNRIRNRKRWSQVMYMYYLLGYRMQMTCKEEAMKKLVEINKFRGLHGLTIDEINMLLGDEHKARSHNTYILALDGDTDFSPGAVRILMDRMVDENVGAACGRIHPIGKGPMVMYQKFEYAVGHWLQKSAEHVFGCVLCSPGCFSLFRAKALMDTNVIKRYTTEPSEPGHHLQFDQGEDRWLCTLLLQRGYKIEYAAAADAWTFAPEGFYEFFNQRRRWMPSTIANILDLLSTSNLTRKVNPNISLPYIMYQWFLMLMTLLGPGTILMMIAGAATLVFKITLINAYLFAIIPAGVFVVVCFWFKQRIQLAMAAIMSVVYTFIMMIVLVGTIITATEENLFHPSVVVIILLMFIFILTGVCHPQEIGCLVHAFLYLMVIPSGYLLLVIYSIINLNDVSWGTREVPTKAQRVEALRKKKEAEEKKAANKNKGLFARIFDRGEGHIKEVANLIKIALPKAQATDQLNLGQANETTGSKDLISILGKIEENTRLILHREADADDKAVVSQPELALPSVSAPSLSSPSTSSQRPTASISASSRPGTSATSASSEGSENEASASSSPNQPPQPKEAEAKPIVGSKKIRKTDTDWLNPDWTKDENLGNGRIVQGNDLEMEFWRKFVNQYLLPIYPSADQKKKTADGLRDLRNNAAFGLIIVNSLWIGLNFMFQLTEAATVSIDYKFGDTEYEFKESILGLLFVIVLLLLLVLQMIGMLIHRMGTLQHLLAATHLGHSLNDVDLQGNVAARIEDLMRKLQMVLRMPAYTEVGTETLPPILAETNLHNAVENLGRSVVTNQSVNRIMSGELGRTIDRFGGISLGASLRPGLMDATSQELMTNVSNRLRGTQMRDRLNAARSYRPRLPPPRLGQRESLDPFNNPRGWGMTVNDIHRMNPNIRIEAGNSRRDINNSREMRGLGALGRSLLFRTQIIQNEELELEARLRSLDRGRQHVAIDIEGNGSHQASNNHTNDNNVQQFGHHNDVDLSDETNILRQTCRL